MTIVLILAALFALLLLRVPVAFALAGLGLALLMLGGFSPLMAPQAILSTLDGFILLAVPLFLLMSNILLKGGVGRDLFGAVHAWVGHWPGGLAVATIVSCGIFAAISGSSVATAASTPKPRSGPTTRARYDDCTTRRCGERHRGRPFELGSPAASDSAREVSARRRRPQGGGQRQPGRPAGLGRGPGLWPGPGLGLD